MNMQLSSAGHGRTDVSIVHDYLIQMGGAEQVVASLHRLFPSAPIYTSATLRSELLESLRDAQIIDTFLSRIPKLKQIFKPLFPLYPALFRSLPPVTSRIALISSSGFSKWVRWSPHTIPVCYCYTPPRFFWDADSYLEKEIGSPRLRILARQLLALMRERDLVQARAIPHYIAISKIVQDRIQTCYGLPSEIINPPVFIDEFNVSFRSSDYYLVASRLVSYKRVDLVVEAFRTNGKRLVIMGSGPDLGRLKSISQGAANIEFRGWVTRSEIIEGMQNCKALIFPGLEDFGITPLEANACGKPVIAFAGGGALETLPKNKAGHFFEAQEPDSLNDAIASFELRDWDPLEIRSNAELYSESHFHERLSAYLARLPWIPL